MNLFYRVRALNKILSCLVMLLFLYSCSQLPLQVQSHSKISNSSQPKNSRHPIPSKIITSYPLKMPSLEDIHELSDFSESDVNNLEQNDFNVKIFGKFRTHAFLFKSENKPLSRKFKKIKERLKSKKRNNDHIPNNQIRIPQNGEFDVIIELGNKSKILDNDATDGEARFIRLIGSHFMVFPKFSYALIDGEFGFGYQTQVLEDGRFETWVYIPDLEVFDKQNTHSVIYTTPYELAWAKVASL